LCFGADIDSAGGAATTSLASDAIAELSGFPASDFIDNAIRTYGSLLIDSATARLAVLPAGEIDRIAEAERRLIHQILNPPPRELPYQVGDPVRVTGGAFAGFYANIETLDDEERIALLMDIFGRQTRIFASHEHLAAIG